MDTNRLIAFLSDPNSYAHRPAQVRLIQTHISIVAIAPPFACKFKKAVDFGWLDFSTFDRRKHFCEREIELNRRLCDGIYIGLQPLYEENGILNFHSGTVVEYGVLMHEIPEPSFLGYRMPDREENEAWPDESQKKSADDLFPLQMIVDRLLPFYRSQPLSLEPDAYMKAITAPIYENFPPFMQYPPEIQSEMLTVLQSYFELAIKHFTPLLVERLKNGCVADQHGDLHLEHIVLPSAPDRPLCIFDCIEFNDSFRQIDRASDSAFLAMDLDFRGYRSQSVKFCSALSSSLNDPGLLTLQELFRAYRACVRAKVHTLTAKSDDSIKQTTVHLKLARRYLSLALRYAIAGTQNRAIAVVGKVGSGKSAFARLAASYLGVQANSSDRIRKELSGLPVLEPTPDEIKPFVYDDTMNERTYERMIELSLRDASEKGLAILDATFSSARRRAEAVEHFAAIGVQLVFVEIQAPDRVRGQRLERRRFRPNQSDARIEDLAFLDGRYSAPDEIPVSRRITVDSSIGTKEETAVMVLKRLIELRLSES